MISKFLILCWCLFAGIAWSQQPLVGVKDGLWLILDQGSVISLPEGFYDVGDFDEKGLAYFANSGKYGVLNSKGTVVVPAQFSRIQSQGHGYFTTLLETGALVIQVTPNELTVDTCLAFKSENPSWLKVTKRNQEYLLNLPSSKRWDLKKEYEIAQQGFGYCSLADSTDRVMFFDNQGMQLQSPNESVVFYPDYIRAVQGGKDRIISENGSYVLPTGVVKVNYTDAFLQYSTLKNTVRVDPHGKTVLDVPFDDVVVAGRDRFIAIRNFKYGLIDGKGTVILAPTYNYLAPYGSLFLADTEQGTGVISGDGTMIVPCLYSSVRQRGSLYEVETNSGLKGLYSTISKKYLLEPKFRKLAVSQTKVRGWLNDQMQLVSYDEKHNVVDQITIENPVSKYSSAVPAGAFDKRLLSIGWFYEKSTIYDSEGFTAGETVKWGVRDENDSVLAEPRFTVPTYIPEMNFSLVFQGKKKLNWMGIGLNSASVFGGIELEKGTFLDGQFISLDTLDGLSRDYARFSSVDGMGYITKNNKVNKVLHIDYQDDEFVRFATSTTNEIVGCEDTDAEGVELTNFAWGENRGGRTWTVNKTTYNKVLLPDAEWNYLSPSGKVLFERSFQFAERFKHQTAIVKYEGSWGLITSDTMIIPAEYSRIERISELGDTVFLVMKSLGGLRFLDRKSDEIPLNIRSIVKMMDHFAIVERDGSQAVINDQYQIVSSVGTTFRAISDRHFFTKVDKEHQVFDATGKLLGTVTPKPRAVLFDSFIVVGEGSNSGLVDVFGDTILPFDFTEIQEAGTYMVATGRNGNFLLSNTGEVLLDGGAATLLVDSVFNNYAVCENDKVKVFNSSGERIWKGSKCSPDLFIGNCLIDLGSPNASKSIVDENLILPVAIKSVIAADTFGYILETRDGFYFFDKKWNSHKEVAGSESMEYLGSGVVMVKKEKLKLLFSKERGADIFRGRPEGKFSDGLLLMSDGRKFHYIGLDFEEVFDRSYSSAKPFNDGYTAVKLARGWTIMDANGFTKSLDSYGEIMVHGNGLFSTSKSASFGLFESDGTQLLPVEYERIKVLSNDIIQAVKEGEIYYFKRDGTSIEY